MARERKTVYTWQTSIRIGIHIYFIYLFLQKKIEKENWQRRVESWNVAPSKNWRWNERSERVRQAVAHLSY
jgi:hypothetical protein